MVLEGFLSILKDLMIFSSYVDTKNSFPHPLSREKESHYLLLAEEGDNEAKEILIKHNLRLVAHIVKKYSNYSDTDELISVGSIGLIKAVNSYKRGKGTELVTYAAKCIENEILMTIRSSKKHRGNVSLYDPIGTDKEGNEITLIDMLSDKENSVILDVEQKIIKETLYKIIKEVLDEREYIIIKHRYGIDCIGLTQREVAIKLNISRSYISRIEKKALAKIRVRIDREDIFLE